MAHVSTRDNGVTCALMASSPTHKPIPKCILHCFQTDCYVVELQIGTFTSKDKSDMAQRKKTGERQVLNPK